MTPDSRLSAAERAALADLEAAVLADDPVFVTRLRGSPASEARRVLSSVQRAVRRGWVRLLCVGWWGLVMLIAGLAAVIGGLVVSVAVSLAGVLVAGVGLRVLAEIVVGRNVRRGAGTDRPTA